MNNSEKKPSGFALLEILVALAILSIAILPVMESFGPSVSALSFVEEQLILTQQARATLNRLLAQDFDTLSAHMGTTVDMVSLFGTAAEAQKETFTIRSVSYTPVVSIQDDSSGEKTLLEIQVTLDTLVMATLKTNE